MWIAIVFVLLAVVLFNGSWYISPNFRVTLSVVIALAPDLYLCFPELRTTSKGELRFAPEGAGTRASWTMNGGFGSNPFLRWFALMADRVTGVDFDAGLANLTVLAEQS